MYLMLGWNYYICGGIQTLKTMNETVKKNGIFFGVLSGVLSVLITTLVYIVDLSWFTSFWMLLFMLAFYIVIACVMLSKTKKELGGTMTFKQGFTTYFLSAVIGILISTAFNIILFNFVDPGARETIKELSIESAVSMMEKFGAPQSEIDKTIKGMQETDQFETMQQLKGLAFSMLFSAVFGLIFAAIFKSKSPNRE